MESLANFSLDTLTYWDWFAFALVCLLLELFFSGVYFFWVASAAFVVGLVLWFMPGFSWQLQMLIFSLDAVGSVFVWRYFFKKKGAQPDVLLNQRDKKYVGRELILTEPIEQGSGLVVIDDTRWKLKGEDMPAGQKVKVVGCNNQHLIVERI